MFERIFRFVFQAGFLCLILTTTACQTARGAKMVGEKAIETGEAFQNCRIEYFKVFSTTMQREINVVVVLPPAYDLDPQKRFPVVHALHGRQAPYKAWTQMTRLREALADQPMIVTSFSADKASWYLDAPEKQSSQFTTFFLDEWIPYVDANYRTTGRASERGVMGFSMGGWGAFHYALTRPQAFASASSASSAMNYIERLNKVVKVDFAELLGEKENNPKRYDDLGLTWRIEQAAAHKVQLPRLMVTCGTEDRGLGSVRKFKDMMIANGLSLEYLESSGEHNWAYWSKTAPRLLDFHYRSFQEKYEPKDAGISGWPVEPAPLPTTAPASGPSSGPTTQPE